MRAPSSADGRLTMADANRRGWTKEQSREAVRRYASGEGAPALAQEYGTTRNAVMGAVHRAGVSRKTNGPPHQAKTATEHRAHRILLQQQRRKRAAEVQRDRQQKPSTKLTRRSIKLSPRARPVDGVGLGILELEGGQCRWPVSGEDFETMFCGDAVVRLSNGKEAPYCAAHRERGTEARTRRPIRSEMDAPRINHAPGG